MRAATLLAILPLAMAAPNKRSSPAPIIKPRGVELIEDKYIVKFKSGSISTAVHGAISSIKADADYTYSSRFNGFAATIDADELKILQNDPNVSLDLA